ncbi:hypothetical protein TeGR_g301 [Tetraparma gracilis]|uniref:Protein ENHANCED DISEASE RESISTANCE 2 C-terminal domain-containing protein n=1 Tax=Tetraparma gracilis TaxID=2962635 RepID=A0ABQ6MGH8_9STRA|nr:hypothetical protein TeGR_g301 [Tetraparma gracilis]
MEVVPLSAAGFYLRARLPLPVVPHSIPRGPGPNRWLEGHGGRVRVRGGKYLEDRVKAPSLPSLFGVLGVDSTLRDDKHAKSISHMSARPGSFRSRFFSLSPPPSSSAPFLLVFNFVLPWGNMCIYAAREARGEVPERERKGEALWRRFLEGDGEFRKERLKIIPTVEAGPWVVQKLVGSKPAILGQKVPVSYHSSPPSPYLEVSVDVSQGGAFANSIANGCMGRSADVEITLSFLVEGREEEELPERLLASVTLNRLCMANAPKLAAWEASIAMGSDEPAGKPAVEVLSGEGGGD